MTDLSSASWAIQLGMGVTELIFGSDSNELKHYGVRGMKWGVRRRRNASGDLVEVSTRRTRAAEKKEMIKNLSDDELRKRINRIQMEKQYSQMIAERPSTAAKGGKAVADILKAVSKEVSKEIVKEIVKESVKTSIKVGGEALKDAVKK